MHHKSARNDHEKNIDSDLTMLKNARRRPSCETAWKRVHFCRSRVALLKKRISKSSKIIENFSQMPAARRANSKCIGNTITLKFKEFVENRSCNLLTKVSRCRNLQFYTPKNNRNPIAAIVKNKLRLIRVKRHNILHIYVRSGKCVLE